MPVISPREVQDVESFSVDGVIAEVVDPQVAERLRGLPCPVVNVASRLPPGLLPSVTVDNDAIGRLGARHLYESGHSRFAFAGIAGHRYSDERCDAFVNELQRLGRTDVALFGRHDDSPRDEPPKADFAALEQWVRGHPHPIGVMACNDFRARHVAQLAARAGIRVPEDIVVVGADNDELQCELSDIPLSSIDVALECVGYEAAVLLDRLMAGDPEPAGPLRVPPIGVVARRSSDVLAIDDADVAAAVAFIREHAHEHIEVEDVLEKVHVSRRTLERRFNEALGRTPRAEIRRAHIERARKLLTETDLPMPDVARGAGLPNAERLSVVFKREVGQTPTAYRRQFRLR